MAPKQSRHDGSADLWLRQQLAEIKRVPLEQVGRIRMTPEKVPSLVDVGVILTGKDARHTSRDIQVLVERYPDLAQKVGQVSFGGRGGNRDSLVPKDLAALIEIIFLLPGRAAAQVRRAAAQIFVRYLGGDLSLIGEVEHLNHVQSIFRENDPEHPLRTFGAAVEDSNSTFSSSSRSQGTEVVTAVDVPAVTNQAPVEAALDWVKDLGVLREDLPGIKSHFKSLILIEIAAGQIPQKSPLEAWAKAPPLRFRDLAECAASSFKSRLKQRYETIAADNHPNHKRRKVCGGTSDDSSDEDEDILKISEIMRVAGVWKAVWSSFRSDLANQMLSLKCEETQGAFADRRQEIVRGNITVLVHKYKKSLDWPLAWKALQNTHELYEKRIRECLEDMFRLASHSAESSGLSAAQLAKDIAANLRVTP